MRGSFLQETRGKDNLLEKVVVQNFMFLFGAMPGNGVSAETNLIVDVM